MLFRTKKFERLKLTTSMCHSLIAGLRRDESGATLILFAVVLPALLIAIGGAIDFSLMMRQRQILQTAADSAALSGAKSLSLADAKRENVDAVVKAVVATYVDGNAKTDTSKAYSIKTSIQDSPLEVKIEIIQNAKTYLGEVLDVNFAQLKVHATARVIGQPNICVLALDPSAAGAISLFQQANVTGHKCSVFSNSDHNNSIHSKGQNQLRAEAICAAGGVGKGGSGSVFSPEPITDCPTFEDPLIGFPEPTPGACVMIKEKIDRDRELQPGTYCGGLTISDFARVKLNPGTYIFKDGPLIVTDSAELHGDEVGFFFKGSGASLRFDRNTTISLGAQSGGDMAGLLIFAARDASTKLKFQILSDNARKLLGTIYLPNSELHIDAYQPIADQSAYTAIVANTMRLYGGPHLVLNADFGDTSVPVPEGLKGATQPVALVN